MPRRRRKAKAKAIAPQRSPSPPARPLTPPDPAKCLLLTRLPPELRHRIYRLVLPPPRKLEPNVWLLFKDAEARERSRKKFRKHERVLALARCSIQLFEEVVPIYYGDNRFAFRSAYDMYRFLFMIGLERRRWIRCLDVFLTDSFQYSSMVMKTADVFKLAFDLLADCVVLRQLGIGVDYSTTDGLLKKRRGDLVVIREWGCFDRIRGMVDLDVRVQEVVELSHMTTWDIDRGAAFEIRRDLMRRGSEFSEDQVIEFERLLKEDFERPKSESVEEGEDEEGDDEEGEDEEGEEEEEEEEESEDAEYHEVDEEKDEDDEEDIKNGKMESEER